jgi:hypothetical protein
LALFRRSETAPGEVRPAGVAHWDKQRKAAATIAASVSLSGVT